LLNESAGTQQIITNIPGKKHNWIIILLKR